MWKKRVGTINDHQHFNISTFIWTNIYSYTHTHKTVIIVSRCNVYHLKSKDEDERKKEKPENRKLASMPNLARNTHIHTHSDTVYVVFIYTTFSPMYPITNFLNFFFSYFSIFFLFFFFSLWFIFSFLFVLFFCIL